MSESGGRSNFEFFGNEEQDSTAFERVSNATLRALADRVNKIFGIAGDEQSVEEDDHVEVQRSSVFERKGRKVVIYHILKNAAPVTDQFDEEEFSPTDFEVNVSTLYTAENSRLDRVIVTKEDGVYYIPDDNDDLPVIDPDDRTAFMQFAFDTERMLDDDDSVSLNNRDVNRLITKLIEFCAPDLSEAEMLSIMEVLDAAEDSDDEAYPSDTTLTRLKNLLVVLARDGVPEMYGERMLTIGISEDENVSVRINEHNLGTSMYEKETVVAFTKEHDSVDEPNNPIRVETTFVHLEDRQTTLQEQHYALKTIHAQENGEIVVSEFVGDLSTKMELSEKQALQMLELLEHFDE